MINFCISIPYFLNILFSLIKYKYIFIPFVNNLKNRAKVYYYK